jgi:hypothetical protein
LLTKQLNFGRLMPKVQCGKIDSRGGQREWRGPRWRQSQRHGGGCGGAGACGMDLAAVGEVPVVDPVGGR